jgi:hypothetical protein
MQMTDLLPQRSAIMHKSCTAIVAQLSQIGQSPQPTDKRAFELKVQRRGGKKA